MRAVYLTLVPGRRGLGSSTIPHKPQRRAAPMVDVVLWRNTPTNYFVVIRCPYCGGRHQHGAGQVHENPQDFASSRRSHCGSGEYILTWSGEELEKAS
jgi:hypothetical protein